MRLEDEIQQKAFKTVQEKALVNIIYTFNWLDSQHKGFFKKFDLTTQQFNILRILRGQHPKPATINLLKERMLDKMCDASRIVERLRVKHLLKRTPCKDDRRSVDIEITEKGLSLLETIDKELEIFNKRVTEQLNSDEIETLNQLLDKLRG